MNQHTIILISLLIVACATNGLGDESATKKRPKLKTDGLKVKIDKGMKSEIKAFAKEQKKASKSAYAAPAADSAINRSPYAPAQAFRPRTSERLTVDLPPKYSELDTDYDGQVGLYEWLTVRRESLDEFDNIDSDRDGLLTPKELKEHDEFTTADNPPAGKKHERPRLFIVGGSRATKPGGSGKSFLSDEVRQKHTEMAGKYFPHIDKDKDGRISVAEVQGNKKLSYMFEQAGIKVTDMSKEDFAQRYVQTIEHFAEQKANSSRSDRESGKR